MSISNLVTVLMISHLACSYLITYKFARLVSKDGYEFKVRWYHKAASTYVLALPIFIGLVWMISKVMA